MVGASKILTVSYGTFSCTLEGFDEPFNTMKAIAEYFRDLAAEDRYFGAEPPQPDAEMLHRIAEREMHRRVEAKVGANSVVLRPQPVEAEAAEPAPQVAPVLPATSYEPEVEAEPVVATPAAIDAPMTAETADPVPDSVAAKLQRIRAAVASARAAQSTEGPAEMADIDTAFEAETVENDAAEEEAERLAAEEAARVEAERLAAEEAARAEAERLAAEEAARVEAERLAAEEAARVEAERLAAEEAARVEAERLAAEEAARAEAERLAAEEAARVEAERLAAEEAARVEAERLAAEEAERVEAERLAAEEAARAEAERLAAEEAARAEAECRAAEEAERIEAERLAAEELARVEAERLAAEEAAAAEALVADELDAEDVEAPLVAMEPAVAPDDEFADDLAIAARDAADAEPVAGFDDVDTLSSVMAALDAETVASETFVEDAPIAESDAEFDIEATSELSGDDTALLAAIAELSPADTSVDEAEAADDEMPVAEIAEEPSLETPAEDLEPEVATAEVAESLDAVQDAEEPVVRRPLIRARVIKLRRDDMVVGTRPSLPAEADAAALSAEKEAELMAELAAADTHPPTEADTPAARGLEDEIDSVVSELYASEENFEFYDADNVAEERIEPVAEVAEPAPREAAPQLPPLEDAAQSARGDADLSRLMSKADEALSGSENRRRFSAIAHLKAAVAATVADRLTRNKDAAEADQTQQFRDDLNQAVRPRRPVAQGAGNTRRPAQIEARPAPLILVSEQRVDGEAPAPAAAQHVVRPRRITAAQLIQAEVADEDMAAEEAVPVSASEAESFAEYAEAQGAQGLADLLEAAAAYTSQVEGRPHFSPPQILRKVAAVDEAATREERLQVFGKLLRQGKITKVKRGQYAITEASRYYARRA